MDKLKILYTLGRPVSPLYSSLMSCRAACYQKNLFKQHIVGVPVISVGNLTMGGTGKTPMVMMLARQLQDAGYRPGVVSRGYGGEAKGDVNVVSDGQTVSLSAAEAGDEPCLLATMLPGVPVLTGKKRILPCQEAVSSYGVDIILLDDGFQHLSVKRDIDIVLFNATVLAGNSRVFPGGDLREPVKALNRTDLFVITGVNDENRKRSEAFEALLQQRFPAIPVFSVQYNVPQILTAENHPVSDKDIGNPLSFCGIANPDRFLSSLSAMGVSSEFQLIFRDHVKYGDKEISRIKREIDRNQIDSIITTSKDLVKLRDVDFGVPLYYLRSEMEPSPELFSYLFSLLHERDDENSAV